MFTAHTQMIPAYYSTYISESAAPFPSKSHQVISRCPWGSHSTSTTAQPLKPLQLGIALFMLKAQDTSRGRVFLRLVPGPARIPPGLLWRHCPPPGIPAPQNFTRPEQGSVQGSAGQRLHSSRLPRAESRFLQRQPASPWKWHQTLPAAPLLA